MNFSFFFRRCTIRRLASYKKFTFKSLDEILKLYHSSAKKVLRVPMFIITYSYKVVLTFTSVDETLLRDRSNESYWAVNSCGTVYYAVAEAHHLTKAIEQYSHVVLFIMRCTRWF